MKNSFRRGIPVVLCLWAAFANPVASVSAELRAGTARVALPDATGCGLAGYPARRVAKGTHDPLQARVLILRTSSASLALVACDLYAFQSRRLAEEAKRRFHIDMVLVASSGSHSAPGLEPDWPGRQVWITGVEDALLRAIEQANASTFAARLGSATAPGDIGYNWRAVDEYGSVRMLWRNPDRRPTGPLSNLVSVWRIDDQDGVPRCLLFHLGCRASTLGEHNLLLSGDFPGIAASLIEAESGGATTALFLQGAGGNIVPYSSAQPAEHDPFGEARQAGRLMAREVLRVSKSISTRAAADPSLEIFRNRQTFHERWGRRAPVPIESATVLINRSLALAAVPGAPFVEHQINLADRSPIPGTLLLGHTLTENGEWAGTLPTIRAAAEGGYGAGGGDTRLEVGAGEALVDTALTDIYRALGKLDDLPRGDLVRPTPPEGKKQP